MRLNIELFENRVTFALQKKTAEVSGGERGYIVTFTILHRPMSGPRFASRDLMSLHCHGGHWTLHLHWSLSRRFHGNEL